MRFLFIILLLISASAYADVPVISFSQKVNMVVTAKKDPRILDMKIEQDKQNVVVDVIVDKNQDRAEIKGLASVMIMQIKGMALDDPPRDKKIPGKGLYDYKLNYTRPDGVLLLTATKPAKKTKLHFEDPFLAEPLTRAGASGR